MRPLIRACLHVGLLTLGLVLTLTSGLVKAATNGVATFTWTAPTQRVDGSVLAANDITGYIITSTFCAGTAPNYTAGTQVLGTVTAAGTATTYTKSDLTVDSATTVHCFYIQTQANVYTVLNGVTTVSSALSDPSAVVWKKIVPPGTTPTTTTSARPASAGSFTVK